MSQSAVILPGSPLAGSTMVGDINAAWAAIISKFSGTVAPTLGPGGSGALVEGQWWLDTSTTPHVLRFYDGAQFVPLLTLDTTNHFSQPPQALRNILMDNGSFEVWQRGAGATASIAVSASTTAYTADRWYVITGVNQASVIAAVTGLTNASNLAAKITRNNAQTGVTAYTFGFPLDTDEVVRMRGSKVTISAFFKAGANWSPTAGTIVGTLYVGTGAVAKRGGGFTGETSVVSMSTNIAPSAGPTGNSAVSAAVVPTNATQGELQFTWTPVGTAGADDSITIDDVQVEIGVFASQFERMPFDLIMQKCKRHFWKTFLYGTAPAQNVGVNTGEAQETAGIAGTTALGSIIFSRNPVSMRAVPSVTTFNPAAANAQVRNETQAADCSATATQNVNTETATITATGSAGQTVGQIIGVHLTVDAGI